MSETSNGSVSNTAAKLSRTRGLKPFRPGPDPRRNLKGRPKSFDEVRALAQQLAHANQNGREAIINVLERWRDSPEPQLQRAFIEYAFGKVPDKLETTGLENKPVLILHYGHQRENNGAH